AGSARSTAGHAPRPRRALRARGRLALERSRGPRLRHGVGRTHRRRSAHARGRAGRGGAAATPARRSRASAQRHAGWAALGLGILGDAHALLDAHAANAELRRVLESRAPETDRTAAALALGLRGDATDWTTIADRASRSG